MAVGSVRARRAAAAGIGVGALAALLLLASGPLEQALGLRVLFALRGPRPAPREVVVLNIDAATAGRLGLPPRPDRWPRARHADVVRALRAAGAGVIAYDMAFDQPQPGTDDARFAAAVREAGNVVLFTRIEQAGQPAVGGAVAHLERLNPPLPALEQAAAAIAPFALPKVPARVDRAWTFKPGAGDAPTLPITALLVYARPGLEELARTVGAADAAAGRALATGGVSGLSALRDLARADPGRLARWRRAAARAGMGAHGRRAQALLGALAAGDAPFLDFYGPPGTIRTVPFDAVARPAETGSARAPDLDGAAVFVGFAEHANPEQADAFLTVYSRPDGVDLSGVEIAATAFANLLEARHPHLPPRSWLFPAIVAWGAALGAVCAAAGLALSAAVATAAAAVWLAGAALAFGATALWVPIVVPAAILPPLAWSAGFLLRYRDARRERQAVVRALASYLPADAVTSAIGGLEPALLGRTVHAVCLCTDVEGYTSLSESLDPAALRERMNRYFAAVFAEVRRDGGAVANLVGDSMLALWVTRAPEAGATRAACAAAIAIAGSSAAPASADSLPTRAGVHAGAIVLGTLGAAGHYEYAPIGDIVNTTSRLESLAKRLGVRVLASAEVAADSGASARPLGTFLLAGKTRPVAVCELRRGAGCAPGLDETFARALDAWRVGSLPEAERLFEACARIAPDDGPTVFYRGLCRDLRELGGSIGGDGVVCLGSK